MENGVKLFLMKAIPVKVDIIMCSLFPIRELNL